MTRYLRQVGTKKAPFIWTPRRAARPDMVEHDPDLAKTRIAALKQRLEDLETEPAEDTALSEEIIDDAKEIADLEQKIKAKEDEKAGIVAEETEEKTQEELDAEEKQAIIEKDADIIKIREMTKKDLCQYAAEIYGITLDEKLLVDDMREQVFKLRVEAIFEKK